MHAEHSHLDELPDIKHPVPDFGMTLGEPELEPWELEPRLGDLEVALESAGPNYSKKQVLDLLSSVRVSQDIAVSLALEQFEDIRRVHERLNDEFGGEHGMVELIGEQLPDCLPSDLHSFPVWYVRLPSSWERRTGDLLRVEQFNPYIDQDPQRPWFIGQWLAIEAGDEGDLTAWLNPHLRIRDDAVMASLLRGSEVGGVIVFIECNGRVAWTGYPIDEGLIGCLQAGGVASCRDPLFEFTVAHLQAQVRALMEGRAPKEVGSVLTLPVTQLERAAAHHEVSFNALTNLDKGINWTWYYYGALGLLKTVSDFVPDELLDDNRLWLKLTVPYDLWEALVDGAASVEVARLPEVDGKALARVTVTALGLMFEAYLDRRDALLWPLLHAYAAQRLCPIAFEALESGYLFTTETDWPADCDADAVQEVHPIDPLHIPRSHYDTQKRAGALALDRRLELCVCNVLDAKRWQEQQRRMAKHAAGPRGGLVAIPSVTRERV